MKSLILLFASLLVITFSFGQENKAHVELGRYDVIVNKVILQNQGFILVTGIPNQVGGRQNYDIHYFNADGTLAWVKPVKLEYGMNNRLTQTIVSPNGKNIYFIEMHASGYYDKKHYISHFTDDGQLKSFVIEGKEEFGNSLQSIFCDDNYLYYLATEDGNEYHEKKKATEKLILNRFKSTDMSYKRYPLNLPNIEPGSENIYWSFIGQKGDEKFLAAKTIDAEDVKNKFTIVSIDTEGKVVSKTAFDAGLTSEKFNRPSYTHSPQTYVENVVDVNYTTQYSRGVSAPNLPSTTTIRTVPTSGAFGHVTYSEQHDCFYVYGLFGPKPFRSVASVYEGFYIYKYDRKGMPSWKLLEMGSKQLMDEGLFRIHGTPISRTLLLLPTSGNTLSATIAFGEIVFPYQITSDGIAAEIGKKENTVAAYLGSTKESKSMAYVEKMEESKKVFYTMIQNTANELVIAFDSKKSTIDVLSFKN